MSAKPDAWIPLYIADYIADTARFSTEQHGAYLLIIMDYWRNGSPPDNDRVLAQITCLTPARWKAHRPMIAPKFQISGGVWRHKRIEIELAKARAMQEELSKRGKAGAAARWQKDDSGNGTSNATGNTQAMPSTMLADAPSPSPSQESLPPPSPSHSPPPNAASARGLISKALRDRGIKGVTPSTPELDAWVAAGISLETVLEAVTLARDKKPEPEQIPFGYIVPIVEQLTTPPKARVNGHHAGRPWFIDTWQAIVAKGVEKGLNESDFETPPQFRAAVLNAHGITPEQVRKAELDWKAAA